MEPNSGLTPWLRSAQGSLHVGSRDAHPGSAAGMPGKTALLDRSPGLLSLQNVKPSFGG